MAVEGASSIRVLFKMQRTPRPQNSSRSLVFILTPRTHPERLSCRIASKLIEIVSCIVLQGLAIAVWAFLQVLVEVDSAADETLRVLGRSRSGRIVRRLLAISARKLSRLGWSAAIHRDRKSQDPSRF